MAPNHRDLLKDVRAFPQLIKYLHDELDWPISSDNFEDLTFDYTPEELGIDRKNAAKIKEIRRLRPLVPNQPPWAIFFVKFEPKRLPVVALRRILSRVVFRKRASANVSERPAWSMNDLLFISNYGESEERRISLAHFSQNVNKKSLPTLKVLGWDNLDTPLHLDNVSDELHSKLTWPEDENDIDTWRKTWTSAFTLQHLEVINTSKSLFIRLAKLAQSIRACINDVLSIETENGPRRMLMKAVKKALIHDLDEDSFADMYAQTIAYGLLSSRITNPKPSTADDFLDQIPITNPFLKDLMETFLSVGEKSDRTKLSADVDFDELGVNEVVELLNNPNTHMEAIVRDFGDRNPQEDPVIHFYELFLKEYDAKKRMQRGVFYTPRPVVSFIVRSVDELLRTKFSLEDGLADTITWGEMTKLHDDLYIPEGATKDQPFVQILDPATGTGTFLVEVIDLIHKTMTEKWQAEGHSKKKTDKLWNEYVPKYLLPRLYGYELLMAPYAIAHLKIGLKLYETGYCFGSEERVRVYLTNALEPPQDFSDTFVFEIPALAHEAKAVNAIKRNLRFTVVIGNPPYSVMSANLSDAAVSLIKPFRYVAGKRIIEKGALAHELNLQDDYIKFFGLLSSLIFESGHGIGSYISNFGFLSSRSLRGMRWTFLNLFNKLKFLNLGGHMAEKEFSAKADQNIFDISQGVAISFLSISMNSNKSWCSYSRLLGDRAEKYKAVEDKSMVDFPESSLDPSEPFYKFIPEDAESTKEFSVWQGLGSIMRINSCCIITSRDSLVIDHDRQTLRSKISRFSKLDRGDNSLEEELGYSVKKKWDVEKSKRRLLHDGTSDDKIHSILYRPFDYRLIYYEPHILDAPARPITESILSVENLVLMTPHVKTTKLFTHALVSRRTGEKKCCSHDRSTQMFPLWINVPTDDKPMPNIDPSFLKHFKNSNKQWIAPYAAFYYIYSILYSPTYREKYGQALMDTYPGIPISGSSDLKWALVAKGAELVAFHLLDENYKDAPWNASGITKINPFRQKIAIYVGAINSEVANGYPKYDSIKKQILINSVDHFKCVKQEIWDFEIGGYQVCHKWLKDRRSKKGNLGRVLTDEDITHYQKIVVALSETIRIMNEIDEVIEEDGGWPGAFQKG